MPAVIYQPLFRGENDLMEIPVARFLLGTAPVTNNVFPGFVRANPQWRRSRVKRLFANENYLKHWAGDTELGARWILLRGNENNVRELASLLGTDLRQSDVSQQNTRSFFR